MTIKNDKSLMRCLGEFVGHIISSFSSNESIKELHKSVNEKNNGRLTLRRTVIDEMIINKRDEKHE